jgi:SAM-dependent methyltransferase
VNPLLWVRDLVRARQRPQVRARDAFAHGLFPVGVATHDLGIRRLFELATVLSLLRCRPGDRVLDLGAGSGFSSEMLARLGYAVVAVDPDLTALGHNRCRVTFDAGRIDGTVIVVNGLAEDLPFGTAAFDGVVGLNVLHHVPDLARTTRELARVLKPGGHAVFCEPGLDHLESRQTQRAIAEYGENDQPFDALAFLQQARASGFARASLSATLHPSQRLVPIEEVAVFASGQHTHPHLTERGVLEELHRRLAFAVLVREGARELTSRAPGVLRAQLHVDGIPARLVRGKTYRATARVTNLGDTRWLAMPSRLGGFVTVGCKITNEAGRLVIDTLGRTFFAADVLPGATVTVDVSMKLPKTLSPGAYELRFDLVDELICWFSDLPDNVPHTVRVVVE